MKGNIDHYDIRVLMESEAPKIANQGLFYFYEQENFH